MDIKLDAKTLGKHSGRWILLVLVAIAAWYLMEVAVHPMMKAAPMAKTMSALIGYGLVVTLVCIMRWSPLQPLLAPIFDEIMHMAIIAMKGSEPVKGDNGQVTWHPVDATVRLGAMIAVALYGAITFGAFVIAGAVLAGVSH